MHWVGSAIGPMLRNPLYRGEIVFGRRTKAICAGKKVILDAPPEARVEVQAPELRIVDESLWQQVQDRIAGGTRSSPRQGRQPTGILVGNARCAMCGERLYVTGKNHRFYVCGRRLRSGTHACGNTHMRPVDDVDAALRKAILDRLGRAAVEQIAASSLSVDTPPPAVDARPRIERPQQEFSQLASVVAQTADPDVLDALQSQMAQRAAAIRALREPTTVASTGVRGAPGSAGPACRTRRCVPSGRATHP